MLTTELSNVCAKRISVFLRKRIARDPWKHEIRGCQNAPKIRRMAATFSGRALGFADKPLEKRLSYQELTNRLRSPRNGLGDIYQIDIDVLGIEK
jgi:hypothetical protein